MNYAIGAEKRKALFSTPGQPKSCPASTILRGLAAALYFSYSPLSNGATARERRGVFQLFVRSNTMRSNGAGLPGYWQDQTIVLLSLFLAASPWLLGYSDQNIAQWNAVIIAVIMAAGATIVSVTLPYWPDFIVAFMAFWLVLSPRILAFTSHLLPTVVAVTVGGSVVVLALWSAIRRSRDLRTVVQASSPKRSVRPPSSIVGAGF